LAFLLGDAPGGAQDAAPPPAAPLPAAPANGGGFFEAFGRFLDRSAANFNSGLKEAQDKLTGIGTAATGAAVGAATAAKDATDAIVKLPNVRFVTGRERCPAASNGSPDCRSAAELICRSNGYSGGSSIDTQSTRKCPSNVWLSGRVPTAADCPPETYVVRAACQ
jgi:hypothetical protein